MAMAVQAQYPSQSLAIFQNDGLDDQQQNQRLVDPIASPLTNMFAGGTALGEVGGGLTSNFPVARKRRREEPGLESAIGVGTFAPASMQKIYSTHTGEENNSVKPSIMSTSACTTPFSSYLDNQTSEMDVIIRHEYEMRAALVEMATKRYRRLVFMVGQSFQRRLKEKESELEVVLKRNLELEENLKQVAAETQLWIAHAKNNEAVAAALHSSLEQALHRSASSAVQEPKEGFGDSPGCLPVAEDEWSSCYDGGESIQRSGSGGGCVACKSCGVAKACVLVLPCRHLCLCQDCERLVGKCPVCNSVKNAGVQVFLS